MDLKEFLGDRFYELEPWIGNTKLIIDDGKLIPKYRFDEINEKYKQSVSEVKELNEIIQTDQAEIQKLCIQIEEIKSGYQKGLNILRVKEIFVEGGMTEKDYKDIVDRIIHHEEDDMIALAQGIVSLVKKKSSITKDDRQITEFN